MLSLEKISTLDDMQALMSELHRLEAKFLFDFYGVLQDFSSKKFFPQWLQKKGVKNVFTTEKGNEVLLKINNSKKRSIVLYDLETPDLNGLQFLAALEKNSDMKERCKVVLVTPAITHDVKAKLLHLGANAIVSKPFGEDTLQVAFEKIGLGY